MACRAGVDEDFHVAVVQVLPAIQSVGEGIVNHYDETQWIHPGDLRDPTNQVLERRYVALIADSLLASLAIRQG